MLYPVREIVRTVRRVVIRSAGRMSAQRLIPTKALTLIIAPHPDDEVFGTGGLMALKRRSGTQVDVLFLTAGGASHKGCCDISEEEVSSNRRRLAAAADAVLGLPPSNLHFMCLPDGRIPRRGEDGFRVAAAVVVQVLCTLQPLEVFCPHPMDCWRDHVAAAEITQDAVRESRPGPRLFYYLTWAWRNLPVRKIAELGWSRSRRLGIGQVMDKKRNAISTYLGSVAPGCGIPYCGALPRSLLAAFEWPLELFFEADGVSPCQKRSDRHAGQASIR